ncbi:hypothetical protein P3L10_020005 [Capsicum annuum]
MPIDSPNKVIGDLVFKCQLGKCFNELRRIMKNENINKLFNRSCFVYFLELPKDRTLHFPMSALLKLRIKVQKMQVKKDGLLGFVVRSSYKAASLMEDLEDKDIPKHRMEKLCLVWFVHSVLFARDIRKVIEDDLLELSDDFDKFNDYP